MYKKQFLYIIGYCLCLVFAIYLNTSFLPTTASILLIISFILLSFLIVMFSHFIFPFYYHAYISLLSFNYGCCFLFFSLNCLLIYINSISEIFNPKHTQSLYLINYTAFFILITLATLLTHKIYIKLSSSVLFKNLLLFLLFILILFINSSNFHMYTRSLLLPTWELVSLVQIVWVIAIVSINICYLYIRKSKLFHLQSDVSQFACLCVVANFTLLFYIFTVFASLPNQICHSWFIITITFIFFLPSSSSSILDYFRTINDKLLLHTKNNEIMSQYIQKMTTSHNEAVKQYTSINSQYTQMMLFYPDAFFLISNGSIAHVNNHAKTLLHATSPDELLNMSFYKFFGPEDAILLANTIERLHTEQLPSITTVTKMLTTSGTQKDVEILFTLSFSSAEAFLIASIRDIAYQKQQDELEKQVALEKLKVEFFSTLSHELKTPVNVIYSATQLQNIFIQSNECDKITSYNRMISQNCLRLLKLLNNLLDLNRIESNYFTVSPHIINVVDFTENTLSSIIPYAERKSIEVIFDTDVEELYCKLDPDMFERILLNLFSNAIKYGNSNGFIKVFITPLEDTVKISITDNGIGIPEFAKNHVFERFARVENGLIRKAEGAGIGLSLVKSFVGLNKGNISFTSQEDVGTEFVMSFPVYSDLTHHTLINYSHASSADKAEIEFSDLLLS